MSNTFFAPQLYITHGCRDISFYTKGMRAIELRRWSNDDGSIHVAELSIDGCIFHLHEQKPADGRVEPGINQGVTALIGLFVDDVDGFIKTAIGAGASLVEPPQDYDYGYRQGEIKDPFGHVWLVQKRIG